MPINVKNNHNTCLYKLYLHCLRDQIRINNAQVQDEDLEQRIKGNAVSRLNTDRGKRFLSSPHPSTPALGSSQPPAQRVWGSVFRGGSGWGEELTSHTNLLLMLSLGTGMTLFSLLCLQLHVTGRHSP